VIGTPASIWGQLANFFFCMAGLTSDLLVVRLSLLVAYSFLLVQGATGYPFWGSVVAEPHFVALDTLLWCVMMIYVHGSACATLLLDERYVKLSDDEAALWRMFYRYSGISRMVFKREILSMGSFREFRAGDCIVDEKKITDEVNLHIILDGMVDANITENGTKRLVRLGSGGIFDFKFLNLFRLGVGFHEQSMTVTATSERVKTFALNDNVIQSMERGSVNMRLAWQAVIISVVARAAEKPAGFSQSEAPRADIFAPLNDSELPPAKMSGSGRCLSTPCSSLFNLVWNSLELPWPFRPVFWGKRHGLSKAPVGERAAQRISQRTSTSKVDLA